MVSAKKVGTVLVPLAWPGAASGLAKATSSTTSHQGPGFAGFCYSFIT